MTGTRLVVVTGGAQGIGWGISQRLAADGSRVAILDINGENAAQAAANLPSGQGFAYAIDVTNYGAMVDTAKRIMAELGVPEVLVSNVGWSPERRFLDTSIEDQQKIIDVNYSGALYFTRAFLPEMVKANVGRLIYVASDAARAGVPGEAIYAGAKSALLGFSKSIALEMARYNITSNVVCPGTTETPQLHSMLTPEGIEKRVKAHPMRRLGTADDIATAVQYFGSRDASFVTGQVISVNGGQLRAG